jgi:hypothetical protein
MDSIEVEVRINETVMVDVNLDEIIRAIAAKTELNRWNYAAKILNETTLNLEDMSEEHKEVIKKFLTKKLELFT